MISPLLVGPLVDKLNFYPTSLDCLSGEDVTPSDFRLPFGLSNIGLLFLAIFSFFFLKVEVPKPDRSLTFKEEFSWVGELHF